ncbi:MAG TPA: PfkB family carbohydrate kinase [Terriglobia bacterium]|nr:PfkB family carbohydrate kinase [Terriglobia bacterium]
MQKTDVVGLGLNAVDTVLEVNCFPALGGKERVTSISRQAGGQVASAVVACRRLGLTARYIGKVGDDEAGRIQIESLRREGIDVNHTRMIPGAATQFGHIIVDKTTGERTVFWDRDPRLSVRPEEVMPEMISTARALHIDGCDVEAALAAARIAHEHGIPVFADLDTTYPQVESLFPYIDYLVASAGFLPAVTGEMDPFRVLPLVVKQYGTRACGMTVGRDGALVYSEGRFIYSPGFVVETVDTTGAGDTFHGALIYGVLAGWPLAHTLDFSNALAAFNCTALGARGGIRTAIEAETLVRTGARHINPIYQCPC